MRLIPFFLLLIMACEAPAPSSEETAQTLQLPVDFVEFYDRFHADSAFQMAHIQWPLQGIPSNDSLRVPGFAYQAENWNLHRVFDPAESGYRSEFESLTDDLIVERINDRQGRYGLMRRWLRTSSSGEWMLIFYQEPMPLAVE
ncbi:MAG: hypothetical protein AAFY36_06490 [Bacteroidota bacterium]